MSSVSIDLAGQAALVTGGSRGIGRQIALQLARAGARVGVVATRQETADEAAQAIAGTAGVEAVGYGADVSDPAAAGRVIEQFVERFGQLDCLVNNAGITRDGLLIRMKDEDWDRVIDVNLKGAFLWTRAAARPMMKKKRGSIINVSSISGLTGNPGQANYSASKAGMIGLTRAVAQELASRSIRVNAICPGFIETEMTSELDPKVVEEGIKRIPLGRFGSAEEVANACLFLASDLAGYITGSVIVVDGGLVLA